VTLVVADTSVWSHGTLPHVSRMVASLARADRLAITPPVTLESLV
jgi:hypothetical protein